jgi:hypothetical protein
MAPLFADKMTIDPKTGALTFDVSNGDRTATFHGTMADDALVGTISERREPVRLPRVRDLAASRPNARERLTGSNARGSWSDVVMPGVVDSGQQSRHGNIDANDPQPTFRF